MTNLSKEKLIDYLRILEDMYKNKMIQETLLKNLNDKISNLQDRKPIKFEYPDPPKPPLKTQNVSSFDDDFGRGCGLTILFLILYLPCYFLYAFIRFTIGDYIGTYIGEFKFIVPAILDVVFIAISIHLIKKHHDQKSSKEDERQQGLYRTQLKEYHKIVKQIKRAEIDRQKEEERYIRSMSEKVEKLKEIETQLGAQHTNTSVHLDRMLQENIIPSKYRDFAPVSYILDYLQSRQNKSWDDACDRYDDAVKHGEIVFAINEVISGIQKLQSGQQALSIAINESNRISSQILGNTFRLIENTSSINNGIITQNQLIHESFRTQDESRKKLRANIDVISYCLQRTQDEMEYMNLMNYYAGRYNNTTYAYRPPHIRII